VRALVAAAGAVAASVAAPVMGLVLLTSAVDSGTRASATVGPDAPAAERGLTPAAVALRRELVATFEVADIGGYAPGSGHISGSDHYTGRALDVMLTPLGPANTELGWRIAHYVQSQAVRLQVTYVIWQGRIWSVARASEGWRPYRHPSGRGGATLLHYDHVHISVR
jgi:hypothetical protein